MQQRETVGNCQNFSILYDKFLKGFEEKDAVKNAWDGVTTALEFNLTVYYFYLNLLLHFLKLSYSFGLTHQCPVFPIYTLSICLSLCRASHRQMSFKVFLKISQYPLESTCAGISFYKETPIQVFSCEYCETFKNRYFYGTPLMAASDYFFRYLS